MIPVKGMLRETRSRRGTSRPRQDPRSSLNMVIRSDRSGSVPLVSAPFLRNIPFCAFSAPATLGHPRFFIINQNSYCPLIFRVHFLLGHFTSRGHIGPDQVHLRSENCDQTSGGFNPFYHIFSSLWPPCPCEAYSASTLLTSLPAISPLV
jgi:hypothetical protein